MPETCNIQWVKTAEFSGSIAMFWNLSQISRTAQTFYQPKSEVERLRLELMPYVDLDDSQLELFAEYIAVLQEIGVDLQNEQLQEAMNAYPENIEPAIEAVLEYAERLGKKHEELAAQFPATDCLERALCEGWKPNQAN